MKNVASKSNLALDQTLNSNLKQFLMCYTMQIDKKVCGIFERWKPKSQFAEAQLLKSTVSFKMYHFCSQYVTSSRHVFQRNKTAKALSAMLNIYSISFKASHEATTGRQDQKSDNLQYYNTLGCWVDGTIVSSTKRLMFQVLFFFIISCKILCKNPFNLCIFL